LYFLAQSYFLSRHQNLSLVTIVAMGDEFAVCAIMAAYHGLDVNVVDILIAIQKFSFESTFEQMDKGLVPHSELFLRKSC
jgi:hypothetical protein